MNYYSKSKYISYKNCEKRIWLDKYKKEEAMEVLPFNAALEGVEFGKLVQGLFSNPHVIEFNSNLNVMVEDTKEVLKAKRYICEASFFSDNLYCAVDILENNKGIVNIYEVKSSTKLKEDYLYDVAYQKYVLEKNNLKVKDCFVIHINSSYVLEDELNINELVTFENVNSLIKDIDIFKEINDMDILLNNNIEPNTLISSTCENYNGCPFKEYCYKKYLANNDNSIINLYNYRNKYKMLAKGVLTMEDLLNDPKESLKLNEIQQRQIEYCLNPNLDDYIKKEEIKSFINDIKYPIYFFDFETYQYMIPKFKKTRPYQQIPFQYSLHIMYEDGSITHKEYLANPLDDYFKDITKSYINDLGVKGSIVAYNASFEKTRIKEAALIFKEYEDKLLAINERFVDLADIFKKGYYYNAKMKNSFSIKSVLPALFGDEFNYSSLNEVHNGTDAQVAFKKLESCSEEETIETRKNMLAYCLLDTLSMVKIFDKLKKITD